MIDQFEFIMEMVYLDTVDEEITAGNGYGGGMGKVASMLGAHRLRDPKTFYSGKAKVVKHPVIQGHYRMQKYSDKYVKRGLNSGPGDVTPYDMHRIGKHAGKRLGAYQVNTDGGRYNYGANMHSMSGERPTAYHVYHDIKNNRRNAAAARLISYIDKRGYDDDSYIAKHLENRKKAKAAKARLKISRAGKPEPTPSQTPLSASETHRQKAAEYAKRREFIKRGGNGNRGFHSTNLASDVDVDDVW